MQMLPAKSIAALAQLTRISRKRIKGLQRRHGTFVGRMLPMYLTFDGGVDAGTSRLELSSPSGQRGI